MAKEDFAALTVDKLKEKLKELKLPVSGNKAELVERLEKHHSEKEKCETTDDKAPADEKKDEEKKPEEEKKDEQVDKKEEKQESDGKKDKDASDDDVDVDAVDTTKEDKKDASDKKPDEKTAWAVGDTCEGHFEEWWYEAKIVEISDGKVKVKFDIDNSEVLLDEAKIRKKGSAQEKKKEDKDDKEDKGDKADKAGDDAKPTWAVGDVCEGHFENWWYEAKIIEITDDKIKVKFDIDNSEVSLDHDKLRKKGEKKNSKAPAPLDKKDKLEMALDDLISHERPAKKGKGKGGGSWSSGKGGGKWSRGGDDWKKNSGGDWKSDWKSGGSSWGGGGGKGDKGGKGGKYGSGSDSYKGGRSDRYSDDRGYGKSNDWDSRGGGDRGRDEGRDHRRSSDNCTVIVSGLRGMNIDRRDLEKAFSSVGSVESSDVGKNEAKIIFREPRAAKEAVRRFHGGQLNDRVIDVHVEGSAPPPPPPSSRKQSARSRSRSRGARGSAGRSARSPPRSTRDRGDRGRR